MHLDAINGWLTGVRRLPSPNCDDRPAGTDIELLVIHGISLPPGQYGGGYIDRLFTNTLDPEVHPYFRAIGGLKVSAHVVIDRAGDLTQYVPFHRRAWHAGNSHFEGRSACNDFSIGIELEGCDDEPYQAVQYRVLADLATLLMRVWPAIQGARIVGHAEIAPGRKTDPGPAFDWGYFRSLLR
ncbi:MAG: 1,6-anhydro-N-acetylmuramyl-L-alanine amidase AmpD [Pseudomonadota bacterium]|nr:1,6-anhydro-N-acetylmuramyl-L-alanine amidase AmpD [Pseudomonadota bacterium]